MLVIEENENNQDIKEEKIVKPKDKIKFSKVISLFVKMLFITLLILVFGGLIPSLVSYSVFYSKYGYEFLSEMFFGLLVTFILIITKNKSVIFKKRESVLNGIKYGISLTVISVIIFATNIWTGLSAGLGVVINLILYSTVVGITEEFLCRGFLQNKFLKKFGKSSKGVYISIIASSLVFGMMHIVNLVSGQTLMETILQIIQTTSIGLLFGAIYYRTGNIWSVVLLHSFYDFAILLGDSTNYVECVTLLDPSLQNALFGFFTSILLAVLYSANAFKLLDKKNIDSIINGTNENTVDTRRNEKYNVVMILAVSYLILSASLFSGITNDYSVCYSFKEYNVDNYELRYIKTQSFQIINELSGNSETFNFYLNDNYDLIMEEKTTGNTDVLIDNISNFEIIKSNNKYIFFIEQEKDLAYKKYYLEIDENEISTDKKFINNLKSKLTEVVTPDIYEMGYIYIDNGNGSEVYPIIKTEVGDIFIIKDSDNVYILK